MKRKNSWYFSLSVPNFWLISYRLLSFHLNLVYYKLCNLVVLENCSKCRYQIISSKNFWWNLQKTLFFHIFLACSLSAVRFLWFSFFFFFRLIKIFSFWRFLNFECEAKSGHEFFLKTLFSWNYNYLCHLLRAIFFEIFFCGSTVNVKMRSSEKTQGFFHRISLVVLR